VSSRILLVEDESSIADNVRVALEQDGLKLDHVKTAMEGLYLARSAKHGLFIFDVGLPDQSGFELCKQVRQFSQTPILFLTARSGEVDKIIGFELGGDDYLTKPFSPRELSARVRAILKRTQSPQDKGPKVYGLFQVDPDKIRISFAGTSLELSRYEYRLLETLIRRPGVVFSRTQLMETVWEDPGMSLERTVDTHIKSIRAKLKAIREDLNPIETHRGLGYSLKES
jgi:two-component system catabolic regulation response regulator CreB